MSKASVPDHEALSHLYQDDEYVVELLNQCLEEDHGAFLTALQQVAKARKMNISQLARDLNMGRTGIYKALSADGNPTLQTLQGILDELGYRIRIERTPKAS